MILSIEILGFRGKDVSLRFKTGRLILVGENGAGKTTLLQICQYLLVGRWQELADFDFEKCIVKFDNGVEVYVDHKELVPDRRIQRLKHLSSSMGPIRYRELRTAIAHRDLNHARALLSTAPDVTAWEAEELFIEAFARDYSPGSELNTKRARRLADKAKTIAKNLDAQVVYLPTYRRIEKEIDAVLNMKDADLQRRVRSSRLKARGTEYLELVEFGMGDVEELVSTSLKGIRDFQLTQSLNLSMAYLADIVRGEFDTKFDQEELDIDEAEVDSVLARIDRSVLQNLDITGIRNTVLASISGTMRDRSLLPEHHKLVLSYFKRLLNFHVEINEKEKAIKSFCRTCESFMSGKRFGYDLLGGNLTIRSGKTEIKLSQLSSGEKQIVSLFCHLYLTKNTAFFVIVDEPELSLSVPWQRRFLEEISGFGFCKGLLAVTHSPFIYDNSLRQFTRSIGQMIKGPDWGNLPEKSADE